MPVKALAQEHTSLGHLLAYRLPSLKGRRLSSGRHSQEISLNLRQEGDMGPGNTTLPVGQVSARFIWSESTGSLLSCNLSERSSKTQAISLLLHNMEAAVSGRLSSKPLTG